MSNVSWCVVIPALIAVLCVNAAVSICVNSLKNVSGGRKVGVIAIGLGSILVFVSLFCVLVWLMYSTPTRFVFEAIDRLINGVVSGMPKLLVLLWFILPLTLAYLIYALMATIYDARKRREYRKAQKAEVEASAPLGTTTEAKEKPKKKAKKKHHFGRHAKRSKEPEPNVGDVLASLVTDPDVDKPIQFRRLVNNADAGIAGVHRDDQYWLIAHNAEEFPRLQKLLPKLLANSTAESYPAIIHATDQRAIVDTEQHGINAFRRALRG